MLIFIVILCVLLVLRTQKLRHAPELLYSIPQGTSKSSFSH